MPVAATTAPTQFNTLRPWMGQPWHGSAPQATPSPCLLLTVTQSPIVSVLLQPSAATRPSLLKIHQRIKS
jgi:hypothetical protein